MPTQFLRPLLDMGITHLVELLEPDGPLDQQNKGQHVMTGAALRRIWGRRAAGRPQIIALNALTRLLNEGPGRDADVHEWLKSKDTDLAKPATQRRVHDANMAITHATGTQDETLYPLHHKLPHHDQKLITAFTEYMDTSTVPEASGLQKWHNHPWLTKM